MGHPSVERHEQLTERGLSKSRCNIRRYTHLASRGALERNRLSATFEYAS
jgi:hypothetical protein